MSIVNFFSKTKYPLYERTTTPNGAGETVTWNETGEILAYIEPLDGEKLVGASTGDKGEITALIYTEEKIKNSQRVLVGDLMLEVRSVEFWQMPYLMYYKGYLVKTDEN